MKKLNMKTIIAIASASILLAFATNCNSSMEESKDDPTLLQYLITSNAAVPTGNQATCLGAIQLANSCVGGNVTGEGYNPTDYCFQGNEAYHASDFATCIAGKVNETSCNLSENKYIDKAAATEGAFADCFAAATLAQCRAAAGTNITELLACNNP
ncbi:hypothetical protein [Leptospira sp. GIMC2001]|uniref:hypothetical protein n=1 Tax=Leptospira sp. GIMC2001 TaxID=1513297 RepID=UPI00234AA270|nr:hypothetical protein [Leptospira sp. GIMC2001]WCL49948.1 hypothetical protein O4O04_03770 [Leptospira sp. GIMC2001]